MDLRVWFSVKSPPGGDIIDTNLKQKPPTKFHCIAFLWERAFEIGPFPIPDTSGISVTGTALETPSQTHKKKTPHA